VLLVIWLLISFPIFPRTRMQMMWSANNYDRQAKLEGANGMVQQKCWTEAAQVKKKMKEKKY